MIIFFAIFGNNIFLKQGLNYRFAVDDWDTPMREIIFTFGWHISTFLT